MTREQAIEEHRKMWRWIAEQFENGRREIPLILKGEYVQKHTEYKRLVSDCFCCHYAYNKAVHNENHDPKLKCAFCPIDWQSDAERFMCVYKNESESGIYEELSDEVTKGWYVVDLERCAMLARRIAELPERVV